MLKTVLGWLAAPQFPDDPVRFRQATILRRAIFCGLLIMSALVAVAPFQPGFNLAALALIYGPLVVWHTLCFVVLRLRWVRSAALLYNAFVWIVVTVVISQFGGMSGQNASVYVVIVLMASFTLGGSWGVVFAALSAASAAFFVTQHGLLPDPMRVQGPWDNAISLVASLTLASFIAFMALRQLHQALHAAESAAAARAVANDMLLKSSEELEASALLAQGSASLAMKLLELRGERELCVTAIDHIVRATQAHAAVVLSLDDLDAPVAEHGFDRLVGRLPSLLASDTGPGMSTVFVHRLNRRDRVGSVLIVEHELGGRAFESYLKVAGHQLGEALLREDLDQRVVRTMRLEALGQLSGGVAHDFNNLLLVIQGSAELLEGSLPDDRPDLRELAQDVLIAGKRAADLTRKLLTFARPMPDQTAGVDIAEVAAEVHGLLSRVVDSRIEVHLHTEPALPLVAGPRANVHQVLFNLCINSRDAMPSGGCLNVRIVAADGPDGTPGVQISVHDTGAGMDDTTLRHLFEPFYTTKDEGKGTGLGLATVWGIMNSVGGTVTVQSRLGEGTEFSIWWPRVEGALPVEEHAPDEKNVKEGTSVLLVDDDVTVRRAVRRILQSLGCDVQEASCGDEALIRVKHQLPDIVISDVLMPNRDGPGLLSALRELHPRLPVLFITGYADRDMQLDAPVLVKPFSAGQLSDCMAKALRTTRVAVQ